MRRTSAQSARLGHLHRSSPAHTTATAISSTAAAGAARDWTQPRRRPCLPIVSRVYPQLLPHHYYHPSKQKQKQDSAPTPAAVGTTPAAHRRTMEGVTGDSPSSTQAAPGSTPDGPSAPAANHAAPGDPGSPNPSGAAAGHAADLRESAGERGEAAAGGHEGKGAGGEGAAGGGVGGVRALPLPTEGGNVQTLEVDGKPISLDHLGPLVVHKDGTMSRISNWGEMTEIERQNTLRILVKRNQVRLGALRQGLQTQSDETR